MRLPAFTLLLLALLTNVATVMAVKAEDRAFGPFIVRESDANTIEFGGVIEATSVQDINNAIASRPDATLLVLNGEGSDIDAALTIAERVRAAGLDTFIPPGAYCHGSCAIVFLGGRERMAEGDLGFASVAPADGADSPLSIAEVVNRLAAIDVSTTIVGKLLGVAPESVTLLSRDEKLAEGFLPQGIADADTSSRGPRPSSQSSQLKSSPQVNRSAQLDVLRDIEQEMQPPEPAPPPQQPRRLAIWSGMDFYGGDIWQSRTNDLPACVTECLSTNECRAFTYNGDRSLRRGPNCFLKSYTSTRDVNAVAIGGQIIERGAPDPGTITLAGIDPDTGMMDQTDFPGGDLYSNAYTGARNAQECRFACVANDACQAFTYVEKRNACWLKGSVTAGRYAPGMVSGVKRRFNIAPTRIIPLE